MQLSIRKNLIAYLHLAARAIIRTLRTRFSLRFFLADVGTVLVSRDPVPFGSSKNAAATAGTTLNIVAHEDDDLLFLSPDLLHAIQAGRNIGTVFINAGDSGKNAKYWRGREAGARAAYAQMCGVANFWTQADAGVAEHPIPVFTLMGRPSVSLAFMRLPDGNLDGSGFASTNYESLQKLWTDAISSIRAIDGSSSYTKATLINTLAGLMSSFQPDQVNMQDYVGTYGDGDHSDHHSVAYFVQSALQRYEMPYFFTGYENYTISSRAANVTGIDLAAKQKAFYVYARHDSEVGDSTLTCAGTGYALWLKRQYTVGSGSGGGDPLPVTNLAHSAMAMVSQNASAG
jgi:LmbE family N-acetylglucosaminyl deacetylase